MLGASLSGCGGGTASTPPPPPDPIDPVLSTRSVCTANAYTNGRARWTVLIYINAANNLQPDSLLNVSQMAQVGSDANVNIVVQWKQADATPGTNPSFIGTRRYLIKQHTAIAVAQIKAGNTTPLDSDRLANPAVADANGQTDMGDYRTLRDFVSWGSRTYPADNFAVVLWDHGSGWFPTQYSRNAKKSRAVSQDDEFMSEIETWQTPLALSVAAQPIDALIIDCSLEQMLEVAYEVRNTAKVMVGSEESPPRTGYPYHQWLADLKAQSDPCTVGINIMNRFHAYYPNAESESQYHSEDQTNITQSVVDLTHVANVATTLDAFGTALYNHASDQADIITSARNTVQHYTEDYKELKDLYHFANLIRTTARSTDLQTAATNVQNALRGPNGAVLRNVHGAQGQANSYGLSIYVPDAGNYDNEYTNLALARIGAPNWARFIAAQRQ